MNDFDFFSRHLGYRQPLAHRLPRPRQRLGGVPWRQPRVPALRRQRELRRDHLPDQGVLRADPAPVQPGHRPVVAVLGQQADRHAVPAGDGSIQGRSRRVLRRGHLQRRTDPRPLPVDGHHRPRGTLGAGLLHRRRPDLARQLVHGRDQTALTARAGRALRLSGSASARRGQGRSDGRQIWRSDAGKVHARFFLQERDHGGACRERGPTWPARP